jgi:hypothetical protein
VLPNQATELAETATEASVFQLNFPPQASGINTALNRLHRLYLNTLIGDQRYIPLLLQGFIILSLDVLIKKRKRPQNGRA